MLDNIFVTYNLSPGPVDPFDWELFMSLNRLGVDARHFRYSQEDDPEGAMEEIRQLIESSDLTFHNSAFTAQELEDEEMQDIYNELEEDYIYENNLYNSHLLTDSPERVCCDKRTATQIASDAGVPVPETWEVDEYLNSERDLPVVLKSISGTLGKLNFCIDRHEQIDKFFDRQLHLDNRILPQSKEDYVVQEFVDPIGDHFNHYRIVTLGDGTIVDSVLSYSPEEKAKSEKAKEPGPFDRTSSGIYDCVDSPLYLGRYNIASNVGQGGYQIPMNPTEMSITPTREEREILKNNGHDPENPTLHPELIYLASENAKVFRNHGVVYSGQDWVVDQDGYAYFIDLNPVPAMHMFDVLYNHGYGDQPTDIKIGAMRIAQELLGYEL